MILLDVFTFLGRLHPLIVHLPLGFLLLACIFQLASYSGKLKHLEQAVPFILLTGFISAVLACIFGYMLSSAGDYDRAILRHHKFSGIILAVVSGLLYFLSLKKYIVIPRKIFLLCFAVMSILMIYTGHEGGSLTHGSNYLTLKTLTKHKREKPASLSEAYIFEDVVHPMLESRCGQCHEGGRLKGRLSVESLQDLLKGGKHGTVVVAGKPLESELYKRITLNKEDEKFMPADGKTPLKKNEIEIIKWWIENANAAEGEKLTAIKNNEAISGKVAAYLGMITNDSTNDDKQIAQNINQAIPKTIDTVALADLRKKGWMLRWILQKPPMLDVTKPASDHANIADAKSDLEKLAKNIIWLNISDNHLTDNDIIFLHRLSNLEKLRLEKNPVTDAVCEQLRNLPHLEAVNLNGTNISSQGLDILKKNSAIKRIYTWNSPAHE